MGITRTCDFCTPDKSVTCIERSAEHGRTVMVKNTEYKTDRTIQCCVDEIHANMQEQIQSSIIEVDRY